MQISEGNVQGRTCDDRLDRWTSYVYDLRDKKGIPSLPRK